MDWSLWEQLPPGFLKLKYSRWRSLSYDLKVLIVELAKKQNFRCVLCSRDKGLILEHDHYPEQGVGRYQTIYNLRGLACHSCNIHLSAYENPDFAIFDSFISDGDYETYIYQYDLRLIALHEEERKRTMKPLNYWRRRNLLQKFDDWKNWGFGSTFGNRTKKFRPKIKSSEDFWRVLFAMFKYVTEQMKADPNYIPPEDFRRIAELVRPILDEVLKEFQDRAAST